MIDMCQGPLLSHPKKNIRKEACWMLSNIAAGSPYQLSQLVNTNSLIPKVLEQVLINPVIRFMVIHLACYRIRVGGSKGGCVGD